MNAAETRFAIYFVPAAESELYRFGAAVLGYDAYSGRDMPFVATAPRDWADTIRAPRVYGFHATLKPPFRSPADTARSELEATFDDFARSQSAIDVGLLDVRVLGSFIALVPAAPCPTLDRLASACVQHFDRFRAPMNEQERARRLAASLTERQVSNLDRWGYPYVVDDFRFHMTLTGPLAADDRGRALAWLKAEFASRPAAQDLVLDRLVIAHQPGGAFRIIRSAQLQA
ncbi:MAG: DUF1045 domain-containing protein [Pseudolabrys sp.]